MINFLKKIFANNASLKFSKENCVIESKNATHLFTLKYQNNIIGELKYENNNWLYQYSEWFKNQNELQPLLEFPMIDTKYQSTELWPFFLDRIPSFKQPRIKNYIEKHPNERTNTAKLLELFGKYSVNNPFKLEAK
jgi:hypothetical protein